MKITALTAQQRDKDRVNVFVDGKYRFSLTISQVVELGIKVGQEFDSSELDRMESESAFGKLYMRALEYALMRPHSAKEMRDYLYRKTLSTRTKDGGVKKGLPREITERVYHRLLAKGYIDDEKFSRYWIENRNFKKGASQRKLTAELRAKGVEPTIIERLMRESPRAEEDELRKVINKKASRYGDETKLIQYLMRQGFAYDDIRSALNNQSEESDQ